MLGYGPIGAQPIGAEAITFIAAPTGAITSQPAVDGQSQRFVGTTTNATSGTYTLTGSNGGVTVGPLPFTVSGNAFDFTVPGLAAGDYSPTLTLTGSGGTAGVSGTSAFSVLGVSGGGSLVPTIIVYGAVQINCDATLVSTARVSHSAAASIAGGASITASGRTLTDIPIVTHYGSASIVCGATVTELGGNTVRGSTGITADPRNMRRQFINRTMRKQP